MILDKLGVLSRAQDLTAGSTDSTNVIQISALDFIDPVNCWLVVDTETVATGDAADTFKAQLVLSQESTLDTNIEILSRIITGYASTELATAGKNFLKVNLGLMLKDILDTSGSDYPYIGLIYTITAGSTWSVNAALSLTEPASESHRQVVSSNVTIPAHVSAGS